jgi:membrane-bound lytic murein transglycosylase D
MFDLEINSYIDERRDLYLSTEAACEYLNYLYNTFHDWHLVLSSYNGGPGEVRKAIERSKGETGYWKIRSVLSQQARNYVPAFIAAAYVMNYYQEHQMVPVSPAYEFNKLDTLHLGYAVSFNQIAALIGISLDEIRMLNPMYLRDYIPKSESRTVLVLPADKVGTYLRNENQIIGHAYEPTDYQTMLKAGADTRGKEKLVHEVLPGEYSHKIALKYGCTIENIKTWNGLEDYALFPGQKLVIWVEPEENRNWLP